MKSWILLADPTDFIRRAIKEKYPKRVLEAESFPQARDLIGRKDISLLVAEILDVTQINYRLIDLVRDARAGRQSYLPVIVYTSDSIGENFMKVAEEVRPDVMLSKLHVVRILYSYIDALLANPNAFRDKPRVAYVDTSRKRLQHLAPYATKGIL